ncbi:MAG: hypothetical protein AAFU85_17345 [Planctomycetota bacterium]
MNGDKPASSYKPVGCGFYDELEILAMRRETALIEYLDESGQTRRKETRVEDVFAKNGEEFLQIEGGTRIRLDQLVRVNGGTGDSCEIG